MQGQDPLTLELQAALRARAVDELRGAAACRASFAREIDLGQALARERVAPLALQELAEAGQVGLLDQEVRARASTLAGAGRATDRDRDPCLETAISQGFHVADRSTVRRDQRLAREQGLGVRRGER